MTEKTTPSLTERERERQIVSKFLRREPPPTRMLLFLGSPRIGKTYLLDAIVKHIETQENRIVLKIPFDRNQRTYFSWFSLRLSLYPELEKQLTEQEQRDHLLTLFQINDETQSREHSGLFFKKLKEILPDTKIVFVLDDIDTLPLSPEERPSTDVLVAQEFVYFTTLPNVDVIASATRDTITGLTEAYWLGLVEKDVAQRLIDRVLGSAKTEEWTSVVLDYADHHPFLIENLCRYIRDHKSPISDTIVSWQSSDSIQEFLNELRSYIDEYKSDPRVNIDSALRCILQQEPVSRFDAEISYLKQWGIIWDPDNDGIPSFSSKLLKQAVENWLFGDKPEPQNWSDKFWQYWDLRLFFWFTYLSALMALVSIGLLRGMEGRWPFNADIGLLWFIIPLLYGFYGILVYINKLVKDRVRKNV